jgi:acyl-CoA thioesterase-1
MLRTTLIVMSIALCSITICSCEGKKETKDDQNKPANSTQQAESDTSTSSAQTTIVFFGNSLTAGYGVDPTEAYPALIQQKLDSLHMTYKVINAGVSGETTSGGLARIDWILRQPPAIFVLELGGNDGLRGIPLTATKKNLQSIIDHVKKKNPATTIILAGMMIPPNMGKQYAREFQQIYPSLATANQVDLIPFLLQGVGGNPALNQQDGIHPTAEGHKIVAENVWKILQKDLKISHS